MIRLVHEQIDTAALRDSLVRPEDGAVVVFEGVVRNHARGRNVRYLEYEAYEAMALKMLAEIEEGVRSETGIREIGIIHRLGRLDISECSIAIVVTASHRDAAFAACRRAIDDIKKKVPIWKKEFYDEGECWIEGPDA